MSDCDFVQGIKRLPVENYLDVSLDSDSSAIQNLHRRIETEARMPAINLTGDGDSGAMSANLTPAMSGWLAEHIARPRQSALSAAKARAARITLAGGVQGVCEEIEEDGLKRDRAHRKLEVTHAFYERYHGEVQDLANAELDYIRLRAEEGNRDARVPTRLAFYGIPALIMLPEFFMNYASFLKLSGVPAVGFGLSIVVALAIAVASYMAGAFWKAYHHYMHPDDAVERNKGRRRIAIASALLTISLTAVGYARYHMVLEQVQAARILGMTPPNLIAQTAGLLAGNLLVFAIGAAITYLMHDENPRYAEKAESFHRLRAAVEGLRRRHLLAKLDGIEGGYRRDLQRMQAKARLMGTQPDYLAVADMMASIDAKDSEVIGALRGYQMTLQDALLAANPDFRFTGPMTDRLAAQSASVITPAEFTTLPLHLYRNA